MRRWLLSLSFAAAFATLGGSAFALPTVNDVQAQVQKGNYTEAQTMMREVVEAKPDSAKAHYIYAEILAHNARFADAAEQARIAKQLDPAVKFTDAAKFRDFEALLDREQQRGAAPATRSVEQPRTSVPSVAPSVRPAEAPAERSSGIPAWVWLAVVVVAFGAWRLMRNRPTAVMGGTAAAGPAMGMAPQPSYGPGPGYGPGAGYGAGGLMQQPGRGGSGMLGTGLAAAGGVAAGMMAERWLEGNREHGAAPVDGAVNNGLGGNTFAPEQDAAAQQLENRDVDFGSGNDWDAGNADGGSFDSGGSGGSDDW